MLLPLSFDFAFKIYYNTHKSSFDGVSVRRRTLCVSIAVIAGSTPAELLYLFDFALFNQVLNRFLIVFIERYYVVALLEFLNYFAYFDGD